jgi:hypothetical protein
MADEGSVNPERWIKYGAFVLFLAALFFSGYANEHIKGDISQLDRVILIVGFVYGAYRGCGEIPLALYNRFFRHTKA